MNYFRLGMSESSLLFLYFIENHIQNYDKVLHDIFEIKILNWLYSTSGFFDIKIKGNYFNFDDEYNNIKKSKTYNIYFGELLDFIKKTDFKLFYFKCHNLNILMEYLPLFFKYINKETLTKDKNDSYIIRNIINESFEGKTILLIHNLSELMINQYINGNLKKINPFFPNVNNLISYKIGYTFLNIPIDNNNNIIERSKLLNEDINKIIKKSNINFIIISCGAYSSLIAKELHKNIKLNYFMIGRELEKEFGIITKSNKPLIEDIKYYVNVPEELKPIFHNEIENSCYW
jgi:hypothetical protein